MTELNFLLRKAAADRERELREWKATQLETTIIPNLEHELKIVKGLGLEYLPIQNRLHELFRQYKSLTGRDYHSY